MRKEKKRMRNAIWILAQSILSVLYLNLQYLIVYLCSNCIRYRTIQTFWNWAMINNKRFLSILIHILFFFLDITKVNVNRKRKKYDKNREENPSTSLSWKKGAHVNINNHIHNTYISALTCVKLQNQQTARFRHFWI